MIELVYHSDSAFVYNLSDWENLRKTYRIVGEAFGKTKFTPTLPVKLTPEETVFLIKRGVGRLVNYDKINSAPEDEDKQGVENFTTDLLEEERKVYMNVRKQELQTTIDKIIIGKRKRGDKRPVKEIFKSELKKADAAVSMDTMIWPIFTEHPFEFRGESLPVPSYPILKQTTAIRCAVYNDLWEKGYYITPGEKFGGDFLVYLGDPIAFHAIYIVRCVNNPNARLCPSEFIAFGRLGTSVKKKAVFASMDENECILYVTINWMDA